MLTSGPPQIGAPPSLDIAGGYRIGGATAWVNAMLTEAVMKTITIFALAVWASSPAAAAQAGGAVEHSTSKPIEQFVRCFVAAQEQASLPWWFVPKDHGGTISNLGASGARNVYYLDVSDDGSIRKVRLELASSEASADRSIARAVKECI